MSTLLSLDAQTASVGFGKAAHFGFKGKNSALPPLTVTGSAGTHSSTIVFGESATHGAHLASSDDGVIFSTSDPEKAVSISHSNGHVGIGHSNAEESLVVMSRHAGAAIKLTDQHHPDIHSTLLMKSGGSLEISAPGSKSGSGGELFVKEFKSIEFTTPNGGSPATIFERADGASAEASGTQFASGKVGIGVEKPTELLHVKGDTWWEGSVKLPSGSQEFEELGSFLELGESDSSDEVNIVALLKSMAKTVRVNHARIQKQQEAIMSMEEQVRRF
jgi:hypothetical protein